MCFSLRLIEQVSLSGSIISHVQLAFETIIEIISGNNRQAAEGVAHPSGLMQAVFLIEHNKTGRVVGPKGANIQNLKLQSGASSLRIEKEVKLMGGLQMRKVVLEGGTRAIKR